MLCVAFLGQLLLLNDRPSESIPFLSAANSEKTALVSSLLGDAYASQSLYREAAGAFRDALALEPGLAQDPNFADKLKRAECNARLLQLLEEHQATLELTLEELQQRQSA